MGKIKALENRNLVRVPNNDFRGHTVASEASAKATRIGDT